MAEIMKCEDLLAALNDYVDGDRASALCQALEEHLADCNPCQVVIDNIHNTITLFKAGEPVALPEEAHHQLRRVLRERWVEQYPPKDAENA